MKRWTMSIAVLSILCLALALPALAEEGKKEDTTPAGQQVFIAQKCQMCHTVFSAGVGEPPKEEEADEEVDEGPPDLSLTGTGRTAEWLSLFLQKKETLNEKKHMKKFKGADEDLTALVNWLLTLKAPEKEAAPAKTAKVEKVAEPAAPADPEAPAEPEAAEKDQGCGHDHGDKADKDAGSDAEKDE